MEGPLGINFKKIRKGNKKLLMAQKEINETLNIRKGVIITDIPDSIKKDINVTPIIILIVLCFLFSVFLFLIYEYYNPASVSGGFTPNSFSGEVSPFSFPPDSDFSLPPVEVNEITNNYYPIEVIQNNITQIKEKIVIGSEKNCFVVKDTKTGEEFWNCQTRGG